MNLNSNSTLREGQYIINRIISKGGFGITYEALHVKFNQPVVIKTPNEDLQQDSDYPKFVERFHKEGQIIFRLRHSHIVRVTDLFDEGDLPCLIMEYVKGKTLHDHVASQGILTEEKAVKYIQQIGSALQAVHELQPDNPVIHRDATPLNIIIQDDDNAILIDFGIAGELYSAFSSTKAFGNPAFAPYEQWQGKKHPTIDIYTLAGSFYYALTGKPPQLNNDGDLIEPKTFNSSISDFVNNAILKGLEFKPSSRPQSMKEWLEMLENQPQNSTSHSQKLSRDTTYRYSYVSKLEKPKLSYPSLVGTWQGEIKVILGKVEIILFIDQQSDNYISGRLMGDHLFNGKAMVAIGGNVDTKGKIILKDKKIFEGYWRLGSYKAQLHPNKKEIYGEAKDEKGTYKLYLKKT